MHWNDLQQVLNLYYTTCEVGQGCSIAQYSPKPHPHKEKDPSTSVDQTLFPGGGDSEHATLGGEVPILSPSMIMDLQRLAPD